LRACWGAFAGTQKHPGDTSRLWGPGQTLGNRSALQFIESDRQVPDALARCVIDRVGDGRGDTDDTNLTYALDAERINAVIDLIDEDHPDVVHVGIHGHMIL